MRSNVPHSPTVAIETLGCKLNQADSQVLARRFLRAGYRLVEAHQPADVYVLNTCTVTHTADSKARQALRAAHRRNPATFVVATGCYAQRAPSEVARVEGIALVVGSSDRDRLVKQVLEAQGRVPVPCTLEEEAPWQEGGALRTRAMVKIQEGCNQVCAYCIVPRVRGREHSVPPEEIVAQVNLLVAQGYREVTLTGTQLGSYGFDLPGASLPALLAALLERTPVERLRVSSLQPQEITPSLLALWEDTRLCPHFHLPLQSGSDRVLRRMRRRYDTALYTAAVERVRARLPLASITTDVIVGFPGETEEDFRRTYRLCQEMAFSRIHAFPYSLRPGTSAAHFPDQVAAPAKRRRMEELLALARELAQAYRRSMVGTTHRVLWEEEEQGAWVGLTESYVRVHAASAIPLWNTITPARVTHYDGERLWTCTE